MRRIEFILSRAFRSALTSVPMLLAAGWIGPAAAEDPIFRISTGVDYSTGDYGDAVDTDIIYVPVTGKVIWGDFTARVTVPYLSIEGPGTVVGGGEGPIVIGDRRTAVTKEEGLGDVVASLMYTVELANSGTYFDFIGKVKLPTASEAKGLGTGQTDFILQLDLTQTIGDLSLFGTVGYKFYGESVDFVLDDALFLSAGFGYRFSKTVSAGVFYDWRKAATRTSENGSEVLGYVNFKLTGNWSLQLYGGTGFSDGSPDANAGLQLSYSFD